MYIIDSKSLAKSIDAYCSFFGITKKQFHKESGISSGTLSQWRNGTYEPDKKSVAKLVQYTCLTVDELLSGNFSGAPTNASKKITATNGDGYQVSEEIKKSLTERDELKRLIDRLTDEEVSAILGRVKSLIFGI